MEGGIEDGLEPDASPRTARYLSSQFLCHLTVLNRILGPRRDGKPHRLKTSAYVAASHQHCVDVTFGPDSRLHMLEQR